MARKGRTSFVPSPCARDAIHGPGFGLSAFLRKLERDDDCAVATADGCDTAGSRPSRRMVVVGNSVARWHKYLAARIVLNMLGRRFSRVDFVRVSGPSSNALTLGGYGPLHQLHCGSWRTLAEADIVLIQYSAIAADHDVAKPLISQLLALPRSPLLLVIKHCSSTQVEVLSRGLESASAHSAVWLARDKHKDLWGEAQRREFVQGEAATEREDATFLSAHNLTFIDSCAALRSLLSGRCAVGGSGITFRARYRSTGELHRLLRDMFFTPPGSNRSMPLADPIHQSPIYSVLQGCLAAAAVLAHEAPPPAALPAGQSARQASIAGASSAPSRAGASLPGVGAPPPPPTRGWCVHAGHQSAFERAVVSNDGWRARVGGRGGNKRWYEATRLGARLALRVPVGSARRILLEYYAHSSLPMGEVRAEVRLTGAKADGHAAGGGEGGGRGGRVWSTVRADGRCYRGCFAGQGFYRTIELARLPPVPTGAAGEEAAGRRLVNALVTVELVARSDGCSWAAKSENGNCTFFSIAGLIGDPETA